MSVILLPNGNVRRPRLTNVSRRQMIALEHAEEWDPIHSMATNDPHKRRMKLIRNKYQLITILTVDLDSPPVWHGRVGFMQSDEYTTPTWMWDDKLEEVARKELDQLMRLPRPIDRYMDATRPKGRPTSMHRFIPLAAEEIDYLRVVQAGGVRRSIKLRGPDGVWR